MIKNWLNWITVDALHHIDYPLPAAPPPLLKSLVKLKYFLFEKRSLFAHAWFKCKRGSPTLLIQINANPSEFEVVDFSGIE